MKQLRSILLFIFLLSAGVVGITWLFNHVNPWLAFLVGGIFGYFYTDILLKITSNIANKQTKSKKQ